MKRSYAAILGLLVLCNLPGGSVSIFASDDLQPQQPATEISNPANTPSFSDKSVVFGYPVENYRTTLQFGVPNPYYGNKIHLGEDVPLKEGTEIHAIADGVIVYYGAAEGYGEQVAVVEHSLDQDIKVRNKTVRRFASIYGHLRKYPTRAKSGNLKGKLTGKSLEWSVGKSINKDDVIGYVNDPPYNGMGEAHLHMGLRILAASDNSREWAYYGYENIKKFPKSNINFFIPFSEAIMQLPR